jgi:Flp pilus assembly protein protease CpaA
VGYGTVLQRPPRSRRLTALLAACGALVRVVLVLPVLLAAALSLAVSTVSGLAKRPRSGLALTQWTRPRSSCSEEDELQLGRL